ncbi:hypothetical protein Tel_14905 [Candidatus Tenderia electrophaga]|jgi:hypothetical protein|uniref:DUF4390 domain-containing protein n=1 Tax=Candidatus Tenderia electrophaga TaxID=1748243 RepID=A0A0S2TGQ4_9GAMM|nr:hypothetical protein Tel_14905 [Candidatus Tenderia electrophaga]
MQRLLTFRRWLAGMALGLVVAPAWGQEPPAVTPGFEVISVSSRLADQVLRLDALFELRVSQQLVEALQNGVALNLLIEIEVSKERDYLWSASVASLTQRYQISYQPLTTHYVLENLNSGVEFQFPSLESLLAVASVLSDFPLLDSSLLEEDARYYGEIRISIDRDSFPVPLRLMSYVTDDWYLASEWFAWPLLP